MEKDNERRKRRERESRWSPSRCRWIRDLLPLLCKWGRLHFDETVCTLYSVDAEGGSGGELRTSW